MLKELEKEWPKLSGPPAALYITDKAAGKKAFLELLSRLVSAWLEVLDALGIPSILDGDLVKSLQQTLGAVCTEGTESFSAEVLRKVYGDLVPFVTVYLALKSLYPSA